jgi:hypothetical protein
MRTHPNNANVQATACRALQLVSLSDNDIINIREEWSPVTPFMQLAQGSMSSLGNIRMTLIGQDYVEEILPAIRIHHNESVQRPALFFLAAMATESANLTHIIQGAVARRRG